MNNVFDMALNGELDELEESAFDRMERKEREASAQVESMLLSEQLELEATKQAEKERRRKYKEDMLLLQQQKLELRKQKAIFDQSLLDERRKNKAAREARELLKLSIPKVVKDSSKLDAIQALIATKFAKKE